MPPTQDIFDGSTDTGPSVLKQDGTKLHRSMFQRQITGDMVGKSEAQMAVACTGTQGLAEYVSIGASPTR